VGIFVKTKWNCDRSSLIMCGLTNSLSVAALPAARCPLSEVA
jgi:hypothetical protein